MIVPGSLQGPAPIVLKNPAGGQIALQFLGDQETIEKARRLLGIY